MVEELLNGLALMKMHEKIIPEVGGVIVKFSIGMTRLKYN